MSISWNEEAAGKLARSNGVKVHARRTDAAGNKLGRFICVDALGKQHGPVYDTRPEAEQHRNDNSRHRLLSVRDVTGG
jgi:hypothetical protein